MKSVDSGSAEVSLDASWRALTRRAAVATGALCALLSLLHDAPVRVASLRGAVGWTAVLLVGELGRRALGHAARADARARAIERRSERTPGGGARRG